jgi:hypothetical protein
MKKDKAEGIVFNVYRRNDIANYIENVVRSIVAIVFESSCYSEKTYSSHSHGTSNR